MKIKTSDLTGTALDWAVAKCEGFQLRADPMDFGMKSANGGWWIWEDASRGGKQARIGKGYSPSTNWAQGGPIIEREKIDCMADPNGKDVWMGQLYATRLAGNKVVRAYGPTPLVAAMRCYVASKLGNEVDIPEELL